MKDVEDAAFEVVFGRKTGSRIEPGSIASASNSFEQGVAVAVEFDDGPMVESDIVLFQVCVNEEQSRHHPIRLSSKRSGP